MVSFKGAAIKRDEYVGNGCITGKTAFYLIISLNMYIRLFIRGGDKKGWLKGERKRRTEIGGGAQFADCFFYCVRFSKVNLSLSSSSSLGGVELVFESESEFVFVLLEFVSSSSS